jgi:transcriptional regulator with XRE-family HTH domain
VLSYYFFQQQDKKGMHKVQSWRTLLGIIIQDSKEKQRILDELDISQITLTRWVNGSSDPRPQNLRQLVNALPQYREQLLDLLREEKGVADLSNPFQDDSPKEIPSEFYEQVFIARASTTENLRFWSMCQLILQQAIGQLDTERQGIAIWVVSCMPPSGPHHKVRSLREVVGLGTPPWPANLEQTAMFLGAESMAGNTVTLCHPTISQNLDAEYHFLPFTRGEHEKSAAIYPILYAGRVAGVLMVSSAEYNHFISQHRTTLIQHYADLIALAFEPEDFYAPEDITLGVMPTPEVQRKHFVNYRRMLIKNMDIINSSGHQRVNSIQADLRTWQKLEDELLKLPIE